MSDPLSEFYLSELAASMRHCPELPREERIAKREDDRRHQRAVEEMCIEAVETPESGAA